VNGWKTNRWMLSWISFGFLGLALSVFTWGLGYKLSLYDPPQSSSHQVPQAKLLSKNEQSATVEISLATRTKSSVKIMRTMLSSMCCCMFLLAFTFLSKPLASQQIRETKQLWRLRHRADLIFFFVLPPPIFA
jgi:hypothetical protein